jgi:hypothetical protein
MTKSKADSSKKQTIDDEFVKRGAEKITDEEVEQVAANAEKLRTNSNQADRWEGTSKMPG